MSGKPCQGFEKAIKVRSKTEIWKLSLIVTNTNLNIPILSGKSLPTSNIKLPILAPARSTQTINKLAVQSNISSSGA
jgi:hypothetical protein